MRLRKLWLALLIGVIAMFAISATAVAAENEDAEPAAAEGIPSWGNNPDPQTTNVPYVGWLGNQIRVAKCLPFIDEVSDAEASSIRAALNISLPGTFQVEDWSGVDEVNAGPRWLNGQIGFNSSTVPLEVTRRGICWSAHVTSNKPGLAVIKLAVSLEVLADIKLRLGNVSIDGASADSLVIGLEDIALLRAVILKHQFLVIWLQAGAPVIQEIAADEPGGNLEDGQVVGDPAGDGIFNPPYVEPLWKVFGVVKATVTGSFPLGNDFATLGRPTVTLPTDWEWLASRLAVDDTSALGGAPGSAAARWDIHDSNLDAHPLGVDSDPFHSKDASCNTGELTGADAVDNCWPGADSGPFSRVNGATFPTIGPFDPLRPNQTLLNNGTLDAYDAPMPPLRVDFNLTADSIGAFGKADKDDVYDSDNTRDQKHDLYAPFYDAYIPAVPILGGALGHSGVAGSFANNFPGFIDQGRYDYWSTYTQASREGYNACLDVLGNNFKTPTGPSQVSVYTDEHGEAFVKFFPYRGLFLSPDLNGLCDVYTPGEYGRATITATGFYPDQQPLWTTPGSSNSLLKVANHLANKTLVCLPKATNVAFCVETVTDFNGDPIEGVKVKFTTSGDAANMTAASIKYNDQYDTRLQGIITSGGEENYVVVTTNARGQAGVEVVHSQNVCIDVTAENWKTRNGGFGIMRFYQFNPNQGVACGGSTPPPPPPSNGGGTGNGGGSSGGGGGGSSAAASESTVVSLGGPVIQAQPVLSQTKTATIANVAAKLFSVKVLQTNAGRFLVVNVKASKSAKKAKVLFLVKNKKTGKLVKQWKIVPAAKVKIQLLGKNGKVIRTVTRTVPVNKAYTINNLKLPKAAASVRTSVTA